MFEETIEELDEQINPANLESWKIDSMIDTVKENRAEISKLKEIADKRIEEIKVIFENKKEKLEKQNSYLLTTLAEYAKLQSNLRKTKTQFKYTSLSGDIIIKRPKKNFVKPKDDKLDEIEKSYPELIETETKKKLKWADFKKNLIEQDGRIFDKETGEDLTNIIETEEKPEEYDVK